MENSFFTPTDCNFKRVAKHLYQSGNGLILCVTQISARKYLTIFHERSGSVVFEASNRPTNNPKYCLPLLNQFFSQYNFLLNRKEIEEEVIGAERHRELQDKADKLRKSLYLTT